MKRFPICIVSFAGRVPSKGVFRHETDLLLSEL